MIDVRKARRRGLSGVIFVIVAAFYAYGALIHVLNIASLTGFDWPQAPLKWQVLDVAYLVLDVVVAIGLLVRSGIGITAFYCAAFSQIALYTVYRDWVLDVPAAFARSAADLAYLDGLVAFHLATCVVVTVVIALHRITGPGVFRFRKSPAGGRRLPP